MADTALTNSSQRQSVAAHHRIVMRRTALLGLLRPAPLTPLTPLALALFASVFMFAVIPSTATRQTQQYIVCKDIKTDVCFTWPVNYEDVLQLVKKIYPNIDYSRQCGFSDLRVVSPHQKFITVTPFTEEPENIIFCKIAKLIVKDWTWPNAVNNVYRTRRQTPYSLRGRYRGQTQSQYLTIDHGNGKDEGKAEAHSAADSSRASVSGSSGMGQAQSQTMYDPSCEDCVGRSQSETETLKRRPFDSQGSGSSGGAPTGGPNKHGIGPYGIGSDGRPGANGNFGPSQSGSPGGSSIYGPNGNGHAGFGPSQHGGGAFEPNMGGGSLAPETYRINQNLPSNSGGYGPNNGMTGGGSSSSFVPKQNGGYGSSSPGVSETFGGHQQGLPSGTAVHGNIPSGNVGYSPHQVGTGAYPSTQNSVPHSNVNLQGNPPGGNSYGPTQGGGYSPPGQLSMPAVGSGNYVPGQHSLPGGGSQVFGPNQSGTNGKGSYGPSQNGLQGTSGEPYGPNQISGPGDTRGYNPSQGALSPGAFIPGQQGSTLQSKPNQSGQATSNGPYGGTNWPSTRVFSTADGTTYYCCVAGPNNNPQYVKLDGNGLPATGTQTGGPYGTTLQNTGQNIPHALPSPTGPYGSKTSPEIYGSGSPSEHRTTPFVPGSSGPYGTYNTEPNQGNIYTGPYHTGTSGGPEGLPQTGGQYSPNHGEGQSGTGSTGGSGPYGLGPSGGQGSMSLPGEHRVLQGPGGIQGHGSVQGPNGLQGPGVMHGQGGLQGPGGLQGQNGLQGPGGLQGQGSVQGPNGFQGPGVMHGQGGLQGPGGLQGQDGFQGPGGLQGQGSVQGPNGIQGPGVMHGQGGLQGPGGLQGQGGGQGPSGLQGPGGIYAQNGLPGPDSLQGQGNVQGPNGLQGPGGIYGQNGLPGTNGLQSQGGLQGPGSIQGQGSLQGPGGMHGQGGFQGPGGIQGTGDLQVPGALMSPGSQLSPSSLPGGLQGTGGTQGPGGFQGPGGHFGSSSPGGQNGIPGSGGQGPHGQYGPGIINGPNGLQGPSGGNNVGQNGLQGPNGNYGSGPFTSQTGPQGTNTLYSPGTSGGQSGLPTQYIPGTSGQSGYGTPTGAYGTYGPGTGGGQNAQPPYGTGQNIGSGGTNPYGHGPQGDLNGGQSGIPNQYGTGQGAYGQQHGNGMTGTGQYGNGLYGYNTNGNADQNVDYAGIPQNVIDPNSIGGAVDGDDSEAEASVSQAANGTIATASSKGGNDKGRAQTHVHGAYTGGGSFSAQAEISGENKAANSEVTGDKKGASSNAQGSGRNNKSQANVQLGSETGSVLTGSQSQGTMHSSNTQVQGSVKGGMADAQARGPGSTSSQAQIGFTPYKEGDKSHELQKIPFVGGGTAAAQSSGRTGSSQSQLRGTFKYGITYNGGAQAGASLDKDTVFPNRLPFDKIDVYDESNKNINANSENTEVSTEPLTENYPDPETPPVTENSIPFNQADIITSTELLLDTKISTERTDEISRDSEIEYGIHTHSDHHKTDIPPPVPIPTRAPPVESRRSFHSTYSTNTGDYEYTTDKEDNAPEDYDVDDGFGPEGADPTDVEQGEYSTYNEFSRDTEQTHQSLHSPRRKGLEVRQTTGGNTQHIVLGSLNNQDAEITQRNSERPDESKVYQPGERVPGTGGYTIPVGFTGSVKSVASKDKTYVVGSKDSPSQAQTVSLTPGHGKVKYTYPASYARNVNPKNLRSLYQPKPDDSNRYVSVSKSVTRDLDAEDNIRKQYSHTYYTKSSSCGYFTFTCTMVSGAEGRKKVCKPKIPTNPDGTPMRC